MQRIPEPVKRVLRPVYRRALSLDIWTRQRLNYSQDDAALTREAQTYWDNENNPKRAQFSHWRGAGLFADEARWLRMGEENLEIFQRLARCLETPPPLNRIIEWGSGGGTNALAFAPLGQTYMGVDITQDSLDECERQLAGIGFSGFQPALITAEEPEAVLDLISEPCDLFLSAYVFEIFPSPDYSWRILTLAHQLLTPGGLAFIQFRYERGTWETATRRWHYARNFPANTRLRIDDVWVKAQAIGFAPQAMTLLPQQPLNEGSDYAYVLLLKQT